jgi:hypothetical protein
MERFMDLTTRFQALSAVFGYGKSSSYSVSLDISNNCYELEGKFGLGLGCYDIGDLPRNLELGPFKTMEELCDRFLLLVEEAEKLAEKEKAEQLEEVLGRRY